MPEGDTVYLTARRLREALAGTMLLRSDFRVPRWATVDLAGREVESITPRGKHLFIRVGGVTIHSHLRLEGSWRIDRAGARPPVAAHQIRIILANDQWRATGVRIPVIDVVPTEDAGRFVEHLGPDLLGPDWDAERAVANLRRIPDRPLGEALLDQRNLAGIGNMYMAEICFIHGIHPLAPVRAAEDLEGMVATAFRLLQANKDHPSQSTLFVRPHRPACPPSGTSSRTGESPGKPTPPRITTAGGQVEQWVYGRQRRPCLVCGSPVSSRLPAPARAKPGEAASAARRIFWCATCQPSPGG